MHEHRGAEPFAGLEEGVEGRRADRHAIDVAADLDAGEAEHLDHMLEFPDGKVHVLQRHGAQACECAAAFGHHAGDLLVQEAQQLLRGLGLHPVGEQLRHRRDHLQGQPHARQVLQPLARVPAFVGDGAVHLARDHDAAVAGLGRGHRRPVGRQAAADVGREVLRHHVRVRVDAAGAAGWVFQWAQCVSPAAIVGSRPAHVQTIWPIDKIGFMDIRSVDLNLLVLFDTMARLRSVNKAAEALALSQSATSGALARLRAVFDDQLFVRTASQMEPTPRALELAPVVHRVVQTIQSEILQQSAFDPARAERSSRSSRPTSARSPSCRACSGGCARRRRMCGCMRCRGRGRRRRTRWSRARPSSPSAFSGPAAGRLFPAGALHEHLHLHRLFPPHGGGVAHDAEAVPVGAPHRRAA